MFRSSSKITRGKSTKEIEERFGVHHTQTPKTAFSHPSSDGVRYRSTKWSTLPNPIWLQKYVDYALPILSTPGSNPSSPRLVKTWRLQNLQMDNQNNFTICNSKPWWSGKTFIISQPVETPKPLWWNDSIVPCKKRCIGILSSGARWASYPWCKTLCWVPIVS